MSIIVNMDYQKINFNQIKILIQTQFIFIYNSHKQHKQQKNIQFQLKV